MKKAMAVLEFTMHGKNKIKKSALCIFCMGFAVLCFSGCVSAGVSRLSDNADKPPNVVRSRVLVIGPKDCGITIDGVSISENWTFRHNNIVDLYPGMHKIYVSRGKKITTEINSGYERYIPYIETWDCEFEFEKGKVYKIEVEEAVIGHSGNILSTTMPGVGVYTRDGESYVVHTANKDIEITAGHGSPLGAMAGNTYIGLHLSPGMQLGWRLGSIAPEFEYRAGLRLISGGFDFRLVGMAGGGPLITLLDETFTFGSGGAWYYGGLTEFYFPKFGIGLGGGFTGAFIGTFGGAGGFNSKTVSFPYVEMDIMFVTDGRGIYFQYYFNDYENWGNRIGVGVNMHL